MSKSEKRKQRHKEQLAKQKARQAKTETEVVVQKIPRVPEHENHLDASVIWSFSYFDEFDWRSGGGEHASFCDVATKLRDYSRRTWGEISGDTTRDHPATPDDICQAARKRLTDLDLDDVAELFRFRFTGTQRLWGFRDRKYFIVLWWDPDHQVWPSAKKHT